MGLMHTVGYGYPLFPADYGSKNPGYCTFGRWKCEAFGYRLLDIKFKIRFGGFLKILIIVEMKIKLFIYIHIKYYNTWIVDSEGP